jgi:hypothetical protein
MNFSEGSPFNCEVQASDCQDYHSTNIQLKRDIIFFIFWLSKDVTTDFKKNATNNSE